MRRVGNVILTTMFVVVCFVSSLAILSAYSSLQLAGDMVNVTLLEVSKHLEASKEPSIKANGEISPALKAFREGLGRDAKGILDSSTVSFLFTVFSIALLTAGVYILSRSQSNLLEMEERAASVATFVTNWSVACALEDLISPAYLSSQALHSASNEMEETSAVVPLRDWLVELHANLKIAAQQQVGIQEVMHKSYLDRIFSVHGILEGRNSANGSFGDLINICEKCIELLKESRFVERYEEQEDRLRLT